LLRRESISNEELLTWILSKLSLRKRVALITIIEKKGSAPRGVGAKMAVSEDGEVVGTIGGGEQERIAIQKALEAIREGAPRTIKINLFRTDLLTDELKTKSQICGGSVALFIDVLTPAKRAFIVGAGHVAKSLAALLSMLGFRITVIDNMPQYANKDAIPMADEIITREDPSEVINNLSFSKDDVVIIVHGDADVEYKVLLALYGKKELPGYIGLLAGKGKLQYILKKLVEQGVSKELLIETLYSPAGLAIGSESPEEIAVAIVAEVLKTQRRAGGVHESLVKEILSSM
jgi:xanthine dehydrogenase accessory factor